MIMEEAEAPGERTVSAAPSLVSDLSWLLSVAGRPSFQARYPQLAGIFDGREALVERVRGFWDDGAEDACFAEMQVLAKYGGVFTATDPDEVWDGIARSPALVPSHLQMPSEKPQELALYDERLKKLRDSPALVTAYVDLLRAVWAPVDAMWQQAIPVIEEAGRLVVGQYERGVSLKSLLASGCDTLRARLPSIVPEVEAGQLELLFVPCLFFGTSMYLEFPGQVVIGTGVGQNDAVARARTESVARRLKAVADPTRLAILHSLATAPSTVGDLAVLFRLAQPTVSMHVKVLRESGLVRAERRSGRLQLHADAGAVEALLGELRQAILRGQAQIDAARAPSAAPLA
jgi:DNA-binding transcriptional ArsR family regulator